VASAQGTTTVDFGAFPGKSDASVAVTGQASILTTSLAEAWLYPKATTDHSADEHLVESLAPILAGNIVAGTGFTIYARNASELFDRTPKFVGDPGSGQGTRIYGLWTVAWAWSD
jgi:hypothetical protein